MPSNSIDPLSPFGFGYVDAFLTTLTRPSYDTVKSSLKSFEEFVEDSEKDPCNLDTGDALAWKEWLDVRQKPSSVNRRLVALCSFYRYSREDSRL